MTGFHSVIPELRVSDVDAALAYYRDVLGFSVEGRHEDAEGRVVFGSVLCGGASFYFSRGESPSAGARCWVFAEEVDERTAPRPRKKARRGFRGYPAATVALYGPDDRTATKVAVGIVMDESGRVGRLERWVSDTGDVDYPEGKVCPACPFWATRDRSTGESIKVQ